MRIRLTRKLAPCLDGIDVSAYRDGDLVDLPDAQAELLVAERWAECVSSESDEGAGARPSERQVERVGRSWSLFATAREQLRHIEEQMVRRQFDCHDERRVEDRVRDELHDARATIINGGRSEGGSAR